MLANGLWQSAPISEVIATELQAFPAQVTVTGCNFRVNARAVRTLVLIIHELATNATKHGALSVSTGHVSVEGRIDPSGETPLFLLTWVERGGPPVGEPTLSYKAGGFSYELLVPLPAIEPSSEPQPALIADPV